MSAHPISGLPVPLAIKVAPAHERRGDPQSNIRAGLDSGGLGSQIPGQDGAPGATGPTGPKGDKGDPGPSPTGGTAVCNGDGTITITFTY